MAKTLTSSQLTFVDITDQRKLSAYLTSNLTTIQTLDAGVYSPSWINTNLVITPQVFVDQIPLSLSDVTITWMRKDGNNAATELTSGETVSNNTLVVKTNNLGNSGSGMITYICKVEYTDPETNQTVNIEDQMTYTLIRAAENAKTCSISGPQVFKYDKSGACTSGDQIVLTAAVQNVNISKWQYYNPTTTTYEDYPTTTENATITSATLNVKNSHGIFDAAGVAKIKLVTTDSNVYDIITIAKIYDGVTGEQGDPGKDGASAYTILLTNESYSFPGTVSTAKEDEVTTEVLAYQGTTSKTVQIKTVDGKEAAETKTATNTEGLSFSVDGEIVTFYSSEELVAASGSVPIVITVDDIDYTKVFSWSVSYTGAGACSLSIQASSQIFKSTDGVNYTPETITLTPIVQNLAKTNSVWEYSTNGGSSWISVDNTTSSTSDVYCSNDGDGNKVLTIPRGFTGYTATVTSIVFRCKNEDYIDSVTVARLSDGQSASAAYTVILSNEVQSIATNNNLIPLESKSFGCAVTVYEGSNQLIATQGKADEGYFKVVLPSNPVGMVLSQPIAGEVVFSVSNDTSISASGTINLEIQIESEDNTIVKSIAYSAARSGSDGTSPVTFMVWAPNGDVFSNQTGTLSLQALAYQGATDITGSASFQWYKYTSNGYVKINSAKSSEYNVNGADVINIQTYKCVMTYNGQDYSGVYTLEDKSDTYISEMLTIGGTTFKNGQGGSMVYVVVRANGAEKDAIPVSVAAPSGQSNGSYWWKVENNSATLMKYNGTEWTETSDDPHVFNYTWSLMDKDGNSVAFNDESTTKTGKVIYLSCNDIYSIGTLQCDVTEK